MTPPVKPSYAAVRDITGVDSVEILEVADTRAALRYAHGDRILPIYYRRGRNAPRVGDRLGTWSDSGTIYVMASLKVSGEGNPAWKYRIVTVSGRGLPRDVDRSGYDTRHAADSMADAFHDGDYKIEAYRRSA